MKTVKNISFLLLVAMLFTQCRKDRVVENSGTNTIHPSEGVNMLIQVVDEQHNPISNATIILKGNSSIQYTDENGVSIYKDLTVPNLGLLATVSHNEYETQYKMINARTNATGITKIMLLKDLHSTNINTGETGNIDDRGFLTLPNTLVDEKGNIFTGEIKVISKYFDPDNEDFLTQAPGALIAKRSNDEVVVLGSLGMYLIELYDANTNTALNIPDGEKAEIKFPIADTQVGIVPSNIPLWSFDEENGFWVEDGIAQLEGDFMVAEVSHFSFWNCDLPYEFVEVKMTFIDEKNEPLKQSLMKFSVDNTIRFGQAYTDSEGIILGKLPLNIEINVELYISDIISFSTTIGPIDNNEDIIVKFFYTPTKIKGSALQCMGDFVEEGYAFLIIPITGQSTFSIFEADGIFELNTTLEDQKLTIVDLQNSRVKEVDVTKAELENSPLDLGEVMLCDETGTTSISGVVKFDIDEDGIDDEPAENIEVHLFDNSTEFEISVFTNQNGEYSATIPPGRYKITLTSPSGYKVRHSGDFSIDDIYDKGGYVDRNRIDCLVSPFENDADNNFQLTIVGSGSVSGNVSFDIDNDGLIDRTPSNVRVTIITGLDNIYYQVLTDINGDFRVDNIPNGNYRIWADSIGSSIQLLDYDFTPDPDGDDSAEGPNGNITANVKDGESDDDNNFVILLKTSFTLCSVLEDTDNDDIGDTPIAGERIELYKRNASGVPVMPLIGSSKTDEYGKVTFQISEPGEYVLYYIGTPEVALNYDNLGGTDLIPDNNPNNTSGNNVFMPVDIIDLEYDDGNTFVFRKK